MSEEESDMAILRIEHKIASFDEWKKAFDSDPAGRKQSGVRRYEILRPSDDPNYVTVDLEFSSSGEAETFLGRLREVWKQVQGTVIWDPQARVLEPVESEEY
jgi:quinol monooxygenase YgiN